VNGSELLALKVALEGAADETKPPRERVRSLTYALEYLAIALVGETRREHRETLLVMSSMTRGAICESELWRIARVRQVLAELETLPDHGAACEPAPQADHVWITWDAAHVARTGRFLTENDYPLGARSAYTPGPGQVGRLDLECGLVVSFYRTGRAVVGGLAKCDHERERASVKTLLREDGWST
jgi:hypothetical protein